MPEAPWGRAHSGEIIQAAGFLGGLPCLLASWPCSPSSADGETVYKRSFFKGTKGKGNLPQTWASLGAGNMGGETGLGCGWAGYPGSHFSPLTWPYQGPLPKFLTGLQVGPPLGSGTDRRTMLPKKGASENLGLSFGGVTGPPQGSPFLCIVARRSCPLGRVPPPAAVSPASWAWSDWPTVRICTGPRASDLSSARATGPPVPAGHGHS